MQAGVATLTKEAESTPGARARTLIPELKQRAAEAERLRNAPKESIELAKSAGLLRTILPKACGGEAHSMRGHLDVISALAEGCSSTAWVVGVGQAHTWLMGHFSEQAQNDVYGDGPDLLVSAVIGPRGKAVRRADGSYLLSGFWPFGSGCRHSSWLLLGAEIFDENGEKLDDGDLLTPTSAVEIKDDWFVAGLAGTGSNSIAVKDLAVPAHRFLSLPALIDGKTRGAEAGDDDWLSRAQAVPVLSLCLVGSSLGLARDALAEFKRAIVGKRVQYTGHVSDEWIPAQVALGHAAAMMHAAELVAYKAADDIDDHARRGASMTMEMRARIRMDSCYVVRTMTEAVDKLFNFASASSLSLKGSLQRDFRDLHAAGLHGLLHLEASAEIYGRVLLGKAPNTPII